MKSLFHLSFYSAPPACRDADVPHTHEYHELLYCTTGEGGQIAGHRQLPLNPGDLFFYPAGMRHCSVFHAGRKFDCYVVGFESQMFTPALPGDGEVLDIINKMAHFEGPVPISKSTGTSIQKTLGKLLAEFRGKNSAYHATLKMMTMQLFVSIARDEEFHSQGIRICPSLSHHDLMAEVIHYLEAFYMNPITVESVLEFCPMSRSQFHLIFKKATGKTLIEYLTDLRLEKAREFLAETDVKVADIAAHTGFKTSSYFGQIFRATTGMTPGEYRQHHVVNTKQPSQPGDKKLNKTLRIDQMT